ncbi:peroxiredoxin family protein [Flexivirga sp. B27]
MIDWIGATLSWLTGLVLVASGVLKLGTAKTFQVTLSQFGLPQWTWQDRRFAQAFPWCEITLGLALLLLPAPVQLLPAAAILALFVAFLVLVVRVRRRPAPVSCNCFGGLGDDTVDARTVIRNGVLVALAVAALILHRAPASVAADRLAGWCYPLPAVLALAVAGGLVVWRSVATRRERARLIRTLTVQDVDGNHLPITEFQDPPTFLVFFSSGCGGCRAIVEHFRWWPNLLKDGYDIQPVFIGSPRQFEAQAEFAALVDHAWYADRSLAQTMGIPFTPAVVLIEPGHPLGHRVTGGQAAIQELVLKDGWREEVLATAVSDEADQVNEDSTN